MRAIPAPKKVGNDDGGASEANGDAASQKQADTDGAAYRHHGELPLTQATVKTTFARRYRNLLRSSVPAAEGSLINHRYQHRRFPAPED